MKTNHRPRSSSPITRKARQLGKSSPGVSATRELGRLRIRLAEAEETLRAIRAGEVDTVLVAGKRGPRVFTLEGAEQAYRMLIECMNEGALTLAADMTILYANRCFARMIRCRLEQVIGNSFRRFLPVEDQATLQRLIKRANPSGSKIQVLLNVGNGSPFPAQISIRPLAKQGLKGATLGMVVTDMTEARRTEELLRDLSQRLVQVQEAERGEVASELHGNITQILCAILVRCQTLANQLSSRDGTARQEAIKLRKMLGKAAQEVERISRNLRPSVLNDLGLAAVLHEASTEFADRTGVALKLACVQLTARLPAETELTLYRILQETLKNVEKHARARNVAVHLTKQGNIVQLSIHDDGIGFDLEHHLSKRPGKRGLGLASMRERATYVGGILKVKSGHRAGTKIEVSIPLARSATATKRTNL